MTDSMQNGFNIECKKHINTDLLSSLHTLKPAHSQACTLSSLHTINFNTTNVNTTNVNTKTPNETEKSNVDKRVSFYLHVH